VTRKQKEGGGLSSEKAEIKGFKLVLSLSL
jgi:hypothetical protein